MLEEGYFIKIRAYERTGLNIRANTIGNVGSVVFDLNQIKNYHTDNEPHFALGGDYLIGNYLEVPEINEEGFFKLTAVPYALPNGQVLVHHSLLLLK